MKPVAFDYERPRTTQDAVRLLAQNPAAKVLAGWADARADTQPSSRAAEPHPSTSPRIPELARIEDSGRCRRPSAPAFTHAAIEDERHRRPSRWLSRRGATRGIAYRAVRTRGTIGGSLAHADPAADWLSCLAALGAEVLLTGPRGRRRPALDESCAAPGYRARAGRNPGRRAHRQAFQGCARRLCQDLPQVRRIRRCDRRRRARSRSRRASPRRGAMQGRPILIDAAQAGFGASWPPAVEPMREHLCQAGFARDAYELNIHMAALRRAVENAQAS